MAATKKAPKKAPAKKAAAKKAPAKKAPAKKAAAKAAPKAKAPAAIKERMSKTDILNSLAESTELNRKQVAAVIDGLGELMGRHIQKNSCGEFVLPGMFKITTRKKPAVRARKGIDPFTGQERMFAAKPASMQVKVRPLKKLKDMAG